MCTALGRTRPEEVNRLIGVGLIVTAALMVVIIPPLWYFRIELVRLLRIPDGQAAAASSVMPAILGVTVLNCILEIMGSILGAHQHIGVSILLQSVVQALNNVAALVFLAAGFGLVSMLFGSMASFAVGLGLYSGAIRMLCNTRNLRPAFPMSTDMVQTLRYGALTLTATLSVAMRGQSDKVILAIVGSQSLVAAYSVAAKLTSLVIIASSVLTTPLITAVGHLSPGGQWDKIKSLYVNVTSLVCLSAGLITVVIAGVHRQVLVLWLGPNAPDITTVFYLLLVGNLFVVIVSGAASALCKGLNRVGIETKYAAVSLVLNAVFTPVFLFVFGPVGTVIASVSTWCASSLLFLISVLRKLNLGRIAVWEATVSFVLALSILVVMRLLESPIRRVFDYGGQLLFNIAATAAICGLLYIAAMWFSCEEVRIAIRQTLRPAVNDAVVS
jgi:O-antigen/teichoic acid export membrane protein